MPTAAESVGAKNGGSAGGIGGALFHFRRAQSLRFPRSSASSTSGCPSPCSSAGTSIARSGSRNYRSKSSKHRLGSFEAQSLLGRMSSGQRLALVSTWRQMRHQQTLLNSLMRKCLVELEQTEPIVKEIFYKAGYVDCWEKVSGGGSANPATLDKHVQLMAKFFDDLVNFVEAAGPTGFEGGEEITVSIKTLGQQHAFLAHTSAMPADAWDKLGEIAVDKICAVECVQRTREAGRAWRTLIAFWTDKIRCGFEGEAKAFSRRPSTEVQSTTDEHWGEDLGKKLQQLMGTECCLGHGSKENGGGGGPLSAPANAKE